MLIVIGEIISGFPNKGVVSYVFHLPLPRATMCGGANYKSTTDKLTYVLRIRN